MIERNSFVFYTEWKDLIVDFPIELKVELYEAIIDYATGKTPQLSQNAKLAFPFIRKRKMQS